MVEIATTRPLLAAVVIGLNEAGGIERCLRSVGRALAALPDARIVYVDSGSTDGTELIALGLGVRVFRLGSAQPPSPAAGRFVGTRKTQSKYVLFVDGDSVVAEGWVEDALERMEKDPSIAVCAGRVRTDPTFEGEGLPRVSGLGTVRPVHTMGGGHAPIIARAALEAAGGWNPFVRCREEEDLAIRLRHFVPGAKLMVGEVYTVASRVAPLSGSELLRRWRRGFVKGPGQILRNAIADGYLRQALHLARPMVLLLALVAGLGVSVVLGVWWQFLLVFVGAVALRAIVTRKLIRLLTVFYSLMSGFYGLIEFLTVPRRTSQAYRCDCEEVVGEPAGGRAERPVEARAGS